MTTIAVSIRDAVCTIELDDPPANTYSYEMMKEIDSAVLAARMDPGVHVIVRLTRAIGKARAIELMATGRLMSMDEAKPLGGLAEGSSLERELQQLLFQSDDAKEGIAASLEKRKPKFSGR